VEKVILTPVCTYTSMEGHEDVVISVWSWEARFAWDPTNPEYLRWLRGFGTTEQEAVVSLRHDRYVEETTVIDPVEGGN
jgi:hypothetical protein